MSPMLTGGFLTTRTPRKSNQSFSAFAYAVCMCLTAGTEVSPERITLLHFPITFNLGNQQVGSEGALNHA